MTLRGIQPYGGIPVGTGYCACGCGGRTRIASRTSTRKGWQRGKPLRYVNGHNSRRELPFLVNWDTGCWDWQASNTGHYGQWKQGGIKVQPHRWFYEKRVGPIPEGAFIHHACENKLCVNPDHLEPMFPRRHTQHHAPRLTAEKAVEIRAAYAQARAGAKRAPNGFPQKLAAEYGVAMSTIRELVRGEIWEEMNDEAS